MDLKALAENIYHGNLSLKSAKIKQRNMENIIVKNCNPKKEKHKAQKTSTLLNAREFYKGRRMILNAFEIGIFPLPEQYPLGMDDWEECGIDSSQYLPEEPDSLLLSSFQRKKRLKKKCLKMKRKINIKMDMSIVPLIRFVM